MSNMLEAKLSEEEDIGTAVTVPHTTGPQDVNPFTAGELYEGRIDFCELKKSATGKPFGKIGISTDMGQVQMSFWQRPNSIKNIEPKDFPKLEKQPCVFSFVANEKAGKIYRNLETLDLIEERTGIGAEKGGE